MSEGDRSYRIVGDLRDLPLHGKGPSSVTWWGTLGFMVLEGMGFALVIGVYLYLAVNAPEWPLGAPAPDLWAGTLITAVLLASLLPNYFVAQWAKQQHLRKAQWGLVLMTVAGVLPLVIRGFEFGAFHVWWDTNAYGSVVWTLLGLHSTHLLTDVADTVVLAVLMFTRHGGNPKRFGDVQDNAVYWNFVVASWLPIYFVLYWFPRL